MKRLARINNRFEASFGPSSARPKRGSSSVTGHQKNFELDIKYLERLPLTIRDDIKELQALYEKVGVKTDSVQRTKRPLAPQAAIGRGTLWTCVALEALRLPSDLEQLARSGVELLSQANAGKNVRPSALEKFGKSVEQQLNEVKQLCRKWAIVRKPSQISSWGDCPATTQKNYKKLITTVSLGESITLQAPDSDVSLSIPEYSPGIYTMAVHTDVTEFLTIIPDDECVVSPVVEVIRVQRQKKRYKLAYVLKVPHCLKGTSAGKSMQVRRHGSKSQSFELASDHSPDSGEFNVEAGFVEIYTSNFSKFTCTSKEHSCDAQILVSIFGKLRAYPEEITTTVNVKVFLLSQLYLIREVMQVSAALFLSVVDAELCSFWHFLLFTILCQRVTKPDPNPIFPRKCLWFCCAIVGTFQD